MRPKERRQITVTLDGIEWTYKIVDESYEDDYGSLRSDNVVYKKQGGANSKSIWLRVTPECYALSISQAEDHMPKIVETCKTCGHTTYNPIYQ